MKFLRDKELDLHDVSIISEGMEIKGSISTKGSLRIDGKVTGNIHAGGNVTIGEKGDIHGDIEASSLTNGGKMQGRAVIREKIILESKSKLKGDLTGKILIIEEGAVFNGKSEMEYETALKQG